MLPRTIQQCICPDCVGIFPNPALARGGLDSPCWWVTRRLGSGPVLDGAGGAGASGVAGLEPELVETAELEGLAAVSMIEVEL